MPPKPTHEELTRQVDALQAEVDTLRQTAGKRRLAEEKFSKAFHNCPVWVVLSTLADGRYVEVNATFLKATGFERHQVIGRTAAEIGTWNDLRDRDAIIAAIQEQGAVQNVEVLRRDRSGRAIQMLFFGEEIEIDGVAHLLSTSIDITAQRATEDALRRAKENLETEVAERTANLARANQALKREIAQRKQVEAALSESERQYRSLVDNSLVGIYTTDIEGRMLYANQALARMFGYDTTETFMAEGVVSRYRDPADRARLIERLKAGAKIDHFEAHLLDRDGRPVTAILCATLEGDRISGVLTDITARKTIETALHESEERYRRLLESNPDAVFCHREGIIILANPAAVALFGATSAEDLLGRDFYTLVHPDDAFKMKKRRDRVVETGAPAPLMTATFLQVDGREVAVEVGGTLVLLDNVPTVQTVARDISARVRADAALVESENRLRLITNHLPHAMVYQLAVRPDGSRSFLHVSDNIRQLHGLSPYDVMANAGLLYDQVLPEYTAELERLENRALKELATFRCEMQCRLPHGETRWFELVSTPRVRADGAVVFDGIDTDITERKRAEELLRHSREQFKRLFTHANVGIALHDLVRDPQGRPVDYVLTDVNPAYTRIVGLEHDAVVGRKASQIYGADKAPYLDTFAAVADSGAATAFETYFPPMKRHFRVVVYCPRAGSFATIFDDITDRYHTEQELRDSLAYNKVLFQESHIPHVVLDPVTGRFTDCNPAAVRIYALHDRDEVIGKSPLDVSAPVQYDGNHSVDAAAQHVKKAMQQKAHRFEWRHQRPDGTIWDAEVYLMTFTHGNRPMLQFSLQDITARRLAQQALADSERRLNDIIDFLPDATWVIDREGRVIAWNRAVERLTGVKKDDMLGKGEYAHAVPFYGHPRPTLVNLLLHRDREWESKYFNLKEEDGMLIAGDSFHPRMGEGERYLSATAAKLFNAQGRVVGGIQSVRDITTAKHAEEEREKLITELKQALTEVRTLSGLLPICAQCKKIRDDRGYWNQIEIYIRERTDADFSHGVCPDCARALYPGLDLNFDPTADKNN
ncbi:MAG: PAS domain S-box protein [Desulfobacterales bacterium]|nr:PAS domain S-box protein [Desulfobacterales bacterium]